MSFQVPISIQDAIDNIENNRYLLPAIQREFVWSSEKVERLFDSLMRNYPISSFLFWHVQSDVKAKYKFYKFLREYRELFKTHNEEISTNGINDFYAILDGQQRLTSLYIGLKGSYAYKKRYLAWKDNEENIPTRLLYLNINNPLKDEEDGRVYEFKFLTKDEFNNDKKEQKWFLVGKILDLKNNFQFNKFLDDSNYKSNQFTYETLSILQNVICSEKLINYFLEKEQQLDKALNIFIRINSGGEPLSYSDLIFSIAVANWKTKDARKEINSLTDEIRNEGFIISKDFILKTFLVLESNDIKFKVNNFNIDNAQLFESNWDNIREAIKNTFLLMKTFGYTEYTLTSKNALIPIIYHLVKNNLFKDYHKKTEYKEERKVIFKWLNVVLLNQTFGSSADTILSTIRTVMKEHFKSGTTFPFSEIITKLKDTGSISTDDEFINNSILTTQKDDKYAFPILALLYPNLDFKNNDFHKDHLHPENYFKEKYLNSKGIKDPQKVKFYLDPNNWNSILNLQLLDANENMSKQDKSLDDWITVNKIDCKNKLIPNKVKLEDFEEFILERRKLLSDKIKEIIV